MFNAIAAGVVGVALAASSAIIPVKDQFLPRSERERDLVAKTVYVANIHPTVERDVLKQFFQMVCGPVSKIRLLGDAQHDTKIAFVEFASKDSTAAALRCTGAMLGPLAIRVSPSKTPVRTDARRRSGGVAACLRGGKDRRSSRRCAAPFPCAGAG